MRSLILTNADCDIPDFNKAPWDQVVLVTPRNSMRARWNSAAIEKHCQQMGNILYICSAEDTIGKDRTTPDMEQRVTIVGVDAEDLKGLNYRIELAIGMKAMVTTNVATEADLANSLRGVVANIILDNREHINLTQFEHDGYIKLVFPPMAIIFEPYHHTFPTFDGLSDGQIPMFPWEDTSSISATPKTHITVHQRQYPLTPVYAFTDHKAQAQTIEPVVVDIGPVPRNIGISPFGVYVAILRGQGRKTIHFLQDFNDKLVTAHPSKDLRLEDERLRSLTVQIGFSTGIPWVQNS
jgi:hypothetical protein